jgi:hypothetical protein
MSVRVYSVCRQRLCQRLIPRPRSPTDGVQIKKLKKRPKSTRAVQKEIDFNTRESVSTSQTGVMDVNRFSMYITR